MAARPHGENGRTTHAGMARTEAVYPDGARGKEGALRATEFMASLAQRAPPAPPHVRQRIAEAT